MEKKKKKFSTLTILLVGFAVIFVGLFAAGIYYFVFMQNKGIPGYASDPSGPDVQFIAPISGTEAEVGDTVMTHVTAADDSGVVLLELWVNGKLSLSQSSPEDTGISPLTLFHGLKAYEEGTYTLVARAYNTNGVVGESPAAVVTVNADTGGDDSPVIYEVQDGDDLDAIAAKAGVSVADIKAANPGVKNVKSNQKIALPKNNNNNPPPNPPNNKLPGFQPQALPSMQPGISIDAQGLIGHLLPSIAPDAGNSIAKIAALQGIPDGLSAKTDGCKVTLSWNDNTKGETGFAIYRRRLPDQVGATMVGVANADEESFNDTVPYPADYEYQVESIGGVINQAPGNIVDAGVKGVQQIVNPKRSQPYQITVSPSENCIQDPKTFKMIYLKIKNLNTISSTHNMAALWVTINDGLSYRVPLDDYQDVVGWRSSPTYEIPIPTNTRLNPDQPFILKFWAAAYTEQAWKEKSEGPKDLGTTFVSHKISEIPNNNTTYYVNGPLFYVEYNIYADDVQWDADTRDATCAGASAPQGLMIDPNYKEARRLQWKHEVKNQPDGFLLYRSYSCPGQEAIIQAPIYIPNQPARARQFDIDFRAEPAGCRYVYELATMSECGQSKRSNAITGDTETGDVLQVTFKDFKINKMPAGQFPAASLTLRAGYLSRKSDPIWMNTGTTKALDSAIIGGKMPNNSFELVLGPGQSPEVFFAVNGIDVLGDETFGSVCLDTLTLPPIFTWPKNQRTEVIQSFNGSCEMTVEFNYVKAKADSAGAIAQPQTDLEVVDIATIGKQFYAKFVNNGPDQLPGTKVIFFPNYGTKCPDDKVRISGPWDVGSIWFSYNTPLWVYLGDHYSKNANYFLEKHLSGEINMNEIDRDSGQKCIWHLTTKIDHDENDVDSYIDTNEKNDRFWILPEDVQPMQDNR